jgi:hypothetical protein
MAVLTVEVKDERLREVEDSARRESRTAVSFAQSRGRSR